jgi:two-component system cell cycle sensor histidine kinase/response regulator CckA
MTGWPDDPAPIPDAGAAQAGRLEIVGRFAAGIAHDLNNLLAAILAASDGIASRRQVDPETLGEVAQIGAAARRGAALVRHLLAFGREAPEAPRVLELRDALGDLAPLLRHVLGREVHLELDAGARDLPVRIDPTRFDQIIVNLAANARDAMPSGGTLMISCRIEPLASGVAGVRVEVRDTGTGIPPHVLPHIFEPFFTTRSERGTGLGLATVQDIVRQAGGAITVESTPSVGTCMTIRLPLAERPTAAPCAGTVLLVEDEPTVRRLGEQALARAGWTVAAVDSAEAALNCVGAIGDLAAVVTDLDLPGLDGAGLVGELRARLGRPALPAVLVSGYAEATLRREGGLAAVLAGSPGTTRFLAKPYALADLAAALREVVSPPG